MTETRSVLLGCSLPLGGALVGFLLGREVGEQIASAHIEAAPKNVGHGPAYVAGGLYLLALFATTFVGAVVGGFAAVRFLRQRERRDASPARQ